MSDFDRSSKRSSLSGPQRPLRFPATRGITAELAESLISEVHEAVLHSLPGVVSYRSTRDNLRRSLMLYFTLPPRQGASDTSNSHSDGHHSRIRRTGSISSDTAAMCWKTNKNVALTEGSRQETSRRTSNTRRGKGLASRIPNTGCCLQGRCFGSLPTPMVASTGRPRPDAVCLL